MSRSELLDKIAEVKAHLHTASQSGNEFAFPSIVRTRRTFNIQNFVFLLLIAIRFSSLLEGHLINVSTQSESAKGEEVKRMYCLVGLQG